ncbi:hypothetical protein OHB31_35625 [Streptomyces microflavus]|uniref:hypothetical protein n=1 Tax=Streptomyces microflavus TaxID=1919 RepID=UPI002DDBEE14|nr:hypothetical protein [Streptomyces microflavus]WSA58641.1 hypothetical protein OHB31_00015 [Streptomyces microflavus]WSA65169.1 hypothetical protein OHB31_35625 [Streptomyces microflavus]
MIDFLKQHQPLIAWLLPIVVTFAGVWLGSRVQAGGGVAQAKAAKEAAETAATATLQAVREQADHAASAAHAAALREQRISAATNLIRADRAFGRVLHTMFREPDTGASTPAYDELLHAWGVVQLVAPLSLTTASTRVLNAAQNVQGLARQRGEAYRLHMQLTNVRAWMPEYEDARRAVEALDAFRAAYEADTADMVEVHDAASAALGRLPGLSTPQVAALLGDCREPEIGPLLDQCWREHDEAMKEFLSCARTVLGIND